MKKLSQIATILLLCTIVLSFGFNFFKPANAVDLEVLLVQQSLVVEVSGGGTTSPVPGTYLYDKDTTVSVTALPDSGWVLNHWLLNGSEAGSANPYNLTMNANYTLTAVFAEIINGDLIVKDDEVTEFVNRTIFLNGSITVKENGTLRFDSTRIIMNRSITVQENGTLFLNRTILIFNQTGIGYNMTFRNPVNGQPKLLSFDSNITSSVQIYMNGASATITNMASPSTFTLTNSFINVSGVKTDLFRILAENSSQVYLNNMRIEVDNLRVTNSSATLSNAKVTIFFAEINANANFSGSTVGQSLVLATNASARADNSTLTGVTVTNATAYITKSTVAGLKAYGNANLTLENCSAQWGTAISTVRVYDETQIFIYKSEFLNFASYNSSEAVLEKVRSVGSASFVRTYGQSKLKVNNSEQIEYFYLNGNSTVSITNTTSRNILAWENSNVSLSKVIVREDLSIFDNVFSRFTQIRSYQRFAISGYATTLISNSNLTIVDTWDASDFSVSNSSITSLTIAAFSNVEIVNSLINELKLQARSIKGNFSGFSSTSIGYWNIMQNNSLQLNPPGAVMPNLTLRNTQIPRYFSLEFSGTSDIHITNAKLYYVGAFDNTVIRMLNSTMETYDAEGLNAKIYSHLYFTFLVTNPQKVPIAGATIKIIDSNGAILDSGTTDVNGVFKSEKLLEGSIISNGKTVERSLIIEASKDNYFTRRLTAEYTGADTTLELPIPLPWWQEYWYLIVVYVVLAIFVVSIVALKKLGKIG